MNLFCRTIETRGIVQMPLKKFMFNSSEIYLRAVESAFKYPTPTLLVETQIRGIPMLMRGDVQFDEGVDIQKIWAKIDVRHHCHNMDTAFRVLQITYNLLSSGDATYKSKDAKSVLILIIIKILNNMIECESSTAILYIADNQIADIGLVVTDESSDYVQNVTNQLSKIFNLEGQS